MADAYVWNAVTGDWDLAANWDDTTTGQDPALTPPSATDNVTIGTSGGAATEVIVGNGSELEASASLTINETTFLEGQFSTGSLNVNGGNLQFNAGDSLTVSGAASFATATALTLDGALTVDGSLSFVPGNRAVNIDSGTLIVDGDLSVGQIIFRQTSSFNVSNGTLDVGGNFTIGENDGTGPFNINDSAVAVQGFFGIGVGNTLTFNAGTLTVGSLSIDSVSFNVTGGETVLITGDASSSTYGSYSSSFNVSGSTFTVDGSFQGGQIEATGGGYVQLAGAANGITLGVDSTSSIEIGIAGGAAAGSVTIDAGMTANLSGSINAPTIVDNGTIVVQAGSALNLNGALSGSGQVQIGSGADLTLSTIAAGTTDTIAFTGTGDALILGSNALNSSLAFLPQISGFNGSDVIDFNGAVTAATYSGSTLILKDGSTVVATLNLGTTYTGDVFSAIALSSGLTQIAVLDGGDTNTPPTGTPSPDQYVWNVVAGSWDAAGNWLDSTADQNPAGMAPGINDGVTIGTSGGSATDVISGTGDSASLTINETTFLEGQFSTGSLSVNGGNLQLNAGDSLTVSGAASFATATALTLDGALTVDGSLSFVPGNRAVNIDSGTLIVDGDLSVGQIIFRQTSSFNVSNGTLDVGGNFTIGENDGTGPFNINGSTVTVQGAFEIGVGNTLTFNAGTLTVGSLSIDSVSFNTTGGETVLITGDASSSTYGSYSSSFNVSGSTFTVDGTFQGGQIEATGGGYVQLAAATGAVTLGADSTSSVEIGIAGGAAAGSVTIDGGIIANLSGSITASAIVDNGTIVVQAGSGLTLNGALSGSGQVQIGSGADLTLSTIAAGTTDTIAFTGTGDALILGSNALNSSLAFLPQISGFNGSDIIDFQGTVTGANYASGILTLEDDNTTVATLALVGNYSGDTFSAIALSSGLTQITVLTGGDTDMPPPGTPTPDQYVWNVVAGSWDAAGDWADTTADQNPASMAPGINDGVTIGTSGGSATDVISGTGDSASLTINETTFLEGQFSTGSLSVNGGNLQLNAGDSLMVSGAASFATVTALTLDGALTVDGSLSFVPGNRAVNIDSGTLIVDGDLSVGQIIFRQTSSFNVSNSTLTVGGTFSIGENDGTGPFNINGSTVTVQGAFEIGVGNTLTFNAGTLTVGSLSIDSVSFNTTGGETVLITGDASSSTYGSYSSSFNVSGSTFTVDGSFQGGQIEATGGGYVQLAAATGAVTLGADSTSSVEIGIAGGAAAGSVTIDGGIIANLSGSITASAIVDNGTIVVQAGSGLTLNGALSGSGQVQIGSGADLTLSTIAAGTTDTIAFTGTGDALILGSNALNSSLAFLPQISGFNGSDIIDFQGVVSSAIFSGTTLILKDGNSVVANLNLGTTYTGETFDAQPISPGLTQISLYVPPGDMPPTVTSPPPITVFQGVTTAIPGISVTDSNPAINLSVELTASQGAMSATTSATAGGGTITGSGTKDLTISGTLAQINADLTTLTYLGLNIPSDSISISANDQLGGVGNATLGVTIDAAPVVKSIVATAMSGADLSLAHLATLTLQFSKYVTLPTDTTLSLSDGETAFYATDSGGVTQSFTYSTTYLPFSALKVDSASNWIVDADGNPVSFPPSGIAVSSYLDAVTDTAANVLAQLGNLEANASHISSITLTGGGTPTLTLTEAQYLSDSALLAKIAGPVDLYVSDATGTSPEPGISGTAPGYVGVDYIHSSLSALAETIYHNVDGTTTFVAWTNGESINDSASSSNDYFDLSHVSDVTVRGGSGNDGFYFGANFSAGDTVIGGSGTNNQIALDGDYSHGLTLGADTITNVQVIALLSGFNYDLTLNAENVAAGQTLTIWAADLASGNTLTLDGSAVTSGNLVIFGGAGGDTMIGGGGTNTFYGDGGSDTMTGGSGTNIFAFTKVSDSTSTGYDTITNFDALADTFQFRTTVTAIDGAVAVGQLDSGGNFDTELAAALNASVLGADHAVLFTPNSGTLAGHTFLVVDANGIAGYEAGADYVFDITGATHLAELSTANFAA